MAKKKRTKGVRIGNVENGGCFYFNEWGEKCCIRSYELMCKLRSNGMPVPLLRNGYSIFNGTKYR